MSNIPVLKPQEVVRILESIGFTEVRQKASHKQFRHEDGRATTVPFHKGRGRSVESCNKTSQNQYFTVLN
jgi:predicted RNA binding protein YcfA (HicA-like mRNA interferase family)